MDKLIIEARVNEYAMRARNPHVPWTPEEIGREAAAVRRAGAATIHFHARQPDGAPAHDTAIYAHTVRAIREASDLAIHPTLGQITLSDVDQRISHIRAMAADPALAPEFASIDLGSTNIDVYDAESRVFRSGNRVYANSTETLLHFLRVFRECGVRPALAAWAVPFVRTLGAFLDMGAVDEPAWVLFVHTEGGILGGHPATAAGLRAFRDALPVGRRVAWAVGCKEGNLLPLAATAIAEGGHVAIGIGDYAYPELGAPTNAELVAEVVRMARAAGREVASPDEARRILGLRPAPASARRVA